MSVEHHFSGFVFDPEHLSLSYSGEKVEIGMKGISLLKTLIENQGQLVAKDVLISKAWPRQIVTDATLNKQIERLRLALAYHCPNDVIIETERGLGYKLVSEVKNKRFHVKNHNKWRWVVGAVFLIPLIMVVFFYQENPQTENKDDLMPFNLAVIPAAFGVDDLGQGGLVYLSQLLDRNPRVLSLTSETKWFDSNPQELAVELVDQKQLDYVLLVDLADDEIGHTAKVELKNNEQISIKANLSALSLQQLLGDINHWTQKQLTNLNQNSMSVDNNQTTDLPDDNFAVESFLRGKKAANIREYTQAKQFFKTAITQQSEFTLAQISLAEVQVLLGEYSQADALLDTLSATRDLSPHLSLLHGTIKANVLLYTENTSQLEVLLKELIPQAQKQKDSKILEKLLYLTMVMHLNLNQFPAAISSTLQQKELIQRTSKDPSRISRIDNNLAYLYLKSNQLKLAEKHIRLAIVAYETSNQAASLLSSYSMLVEMLLIQAQLDQAVLAVEKMERVDHTGINPRILYGVKNLTSLVLSGVGRHDEAFHEFTEMENMALIIQTDEPKILALGNEISLLTDKNDLTSLDLKIAAFADFFKGKKVDLKYLYGEALPILIKANLKIPHLQQAEAYLEEYKTYTTENDVILNRWQTLMAHWLFINHQTLQAEELLQKALDGLVQKQHFIFALEAAYLWLDLDQTQGYDKHNQILSKIESIKPFAYPYLKYKAHYLAHQNKPFEAAQLMQQMKTESNQWWSLDDQKLLDQYLSEAK